MILEAAHEDLRISLSPLVSKSEGYMPILFH